MKALPWILTTVLLMTILACKEKDRDHTTHREDTHEEHGHEEREDGDEIGEALISPTSAKLIGLNFVQPELRVLAKEYPAAGKIIAVRENTQQLIPRHGGTLVHMRKGLGDGVQQGDTLALLQNPETLATYAETAARSGVVTDVAASVGEVVSGVLMTIVDLSSVWLEIPMPERYAMELKKGMRGAAHRESPQGVVSTPFRIDYLSPIIDGETRTQMLRATLNNAKKIWKPGQLVRVALWGDTQEPLLAIPEHAIQTWEGGRIVFSPENDSVFAALKIIVGRKSEGWIEVVSGLELGDSVVGTGAFELKSKMITANMGDGHNH